MKLRDYQLRYVDRVNSALAGGAATLVVAPTGAGKGTIAAHLAEREIAAGRRATFVTHLRDIGEDFAARMRAHGVRVGLRMPGHERDDGAPLQVVTVQTLARGDAGSCDLLLVDEAHHYRASEWQATIARVSAGRMVGFTATPQRADGRGLGDVFDELVSEVTYAELLASGHTVPVRALIPERRLDGQTAMAPSEAYIKHALGRPAFIFLRSLDTAERELAALASAGVRAGLVTDRTPYDERRALVQGLRNGSLDVLLNYGTMTEGVDVPRVSCVVIEQACKHIGAFIQRVGRAMRATEGKRDAVALDLSGTSYLHGIPWERELAYALNGDPMAPLGMVRLKGGFRRGAKDGSGVAGVQLVDATEKLVLGESLPRFVSWDEVDWNKSCPQIARELGNVSQATVNSERMRRGLPPTRKRLRWDAFDGVDFGRMHNVQIAEMTGASRKAVARERQRRGVPSPGRWGSERRSSGAAGPKGRKMLTHAAVTRTAAEWSRALGDPSGTLVAKRLGRGWSVADAVTVPPSRANCGRRKRVDRAQGADGPRGEP